MRNIHCNLGWMASRQLVDRLWHKVALSAGLTVVVMLWVNSEAWAGPLMQETTGNGGTAIAPAFVPLLAAAASVERAIEIGWNYIEWGIVRYAGWRPDELKRADYKQFKNGTSMLAAIVLGIVVVNYSNMRLLSYMGNVIPEFVEGIPAMWDILLTGLLVGAGSKPAHDLLGLITRFKNFVGNSAIRQREEAGAALADYVLKLGEADMATQVDVPGAGVPGTRSVAGPGQPAARAARMNTYVDVVRRRLDQDYT